MKEKIISILYPRRCPVCDNIVYPKGQKICTDCSSKIPFITGPRCMKCSKPVSNEVIEYCYDCSKNKHLYESGISLIEHKGAVRKSIYSIKYKNRREYIDYYTEEIVKRFGNDIEKWNPDALIPVPMFKKKENKRGFNQADEIAKRIGRLTGIKVLDGVIKRVVNTKPQKDLSDTDRRKNLENAFIISENIVKLDKVILIDDIYTTGSTIDSCTEVLLNAGVKKVYFISLSIGDGF